MTPAEALAACGITPPRVASCLRLLDMIRAAAERGEKCPNNEAMCEALGYTSNGAMSSLLAYLQRAKLIQIYTQAGIWRQVAAADGSWRTAPRPAQGVPLRAARNSHSRGGRAKPAPGTITTTPNANSMFWRPKRAKYPPPAPEEAARLIAEAVAAGRVTVCPAAAPQLAPGNVGMGWK
ncbi:hypothetical protein UFOVP78_27 [uncultured Caudovirales phage]|uniref:Uncharacterized protein n=1 Tax=uncultured Caudovirales phage TaxID=2100421 RepID=A0A6J5KWR5_9CAUD|nr:hypothetical protein UFOVP78_27 [uncultured Caudovirales phage]